MSRTPTHLQRIVQLQSEGKNEQAVVMLRRALGAEPGNLDLLTAAGAVLLRAGEHAQAEHYARKAVAAAPGAGLARFVLGSVLAAAGRVDAATEPFEKAVELSPRDAKFRLTLGNALLATHRPAAAVEALGPGLVSNPGDAGLTRGYALALNAVGRVEEGVRCLRALAAANPSSPEIASSLCSMLNYAPGVSRGEAAAAHRAFGVLMERSVRRLPAVAVSREGPLRVGLMSGDLREHSVSYFIEPLLEHADKGRVFFAGYALGTREDSVTARLRGHCGVWRSIGGMSADQGAAAVRGDRIDVLIDLCGHTSGQRLDILTRKPAPVQATYLGYPNTTGLASVDLRLVDSATDPAGSEAFSTESLVRLDPCFLCYRPPLDAPGVGAPACGESGPVTFCSFNSLYKLNEPLVGLWSRVLKAVPGSRLLLKQVGLGEERARRGLEERFAAHGIEAGRVEALPPTGGVAEHLAMYGRADISLDSFPYNGTTTICESLLMGVPVVSLAGEHSASRVGLSILNAAGFGEWCAETEDGFVEIAAGLARHRAGLALLRGRLRGALMGSVLCDGRGFAERFTAMLELRVRGG